MAKLFIGIALVVMLATAALSFLAKGNIDKLQTSLKDTKAKQALAEGQAKTAKNEEEKAKKEAKDSAEKEATATALAAAKTAEADKNATAAKEAQALVEASTTKIAELQKALDDAKKPDGTPKEDPRVADLTTQLQNATKELAEQHQLVDSITAKGAANETQLAELKKKEQARALKTGLSGLQARILAVNAGWNFVVLSVGDKQGVSVNAPLLVVRGTQPIAKLRITSVEPSTSIADVLPGSVPHGISVQPGDTVIFQGRTSATEPDKASAEVPGLNPALPAH